MALSEEDKNEISGLLKQLTAAVPGFRSRQSQRQMIAVVANNIGRTKEADTRPIVVVEAGTGIGKTASYLIPTIALARRYKKKVVVTSATVALQEQILHKDIPTIVRLHGGGLQYALVKGRGRYVCRTRLDALSGRFAQSTLLPEAEAVWDEPPKQEDIDLLFELSQRLETRSWDGDRDSLAESIPDPIWQKIANDASSCTNRGCSHFKSCGFFTTRAAAKQCDILIANHDLVLSTLQGQTGGVFPDPEETILVIDEAHHLPTKAVDQFAASHFLKAAHKWILQLPNCVEHLVAGYPGAPGAAAVTRAAQQLDRSLLDLEQLLDHAPALARNQGTRGTVQTASNNVTWRFPYGELPAEIATIGANISNAAHSAHDTLTTTLDEMMAYHKEAGSSLQMEKVFSEAAFLASKLQAVCEVWDMMLKTADGKEPPMAKWISRIPGNKRADYLICACPVSAADMLSRLIWNRFSAVVVTSATLTALGRFDLFKSKTGLYRFTDTQYFQLPSPFDYANKGRLVVPPMRSDPKNAEEHTAEIIELLPALIDVSNGCGTLVLFASRRQMMDVALRMPSGLSKFILTQGELPKAEILRIHRDRIERGWSSVIFGLASFNEGVDLPRRLCTHVIIAKIPFSPPDSPVEQATAEWLEKLGRRPFYDLTVPEASVRLIQGVGRLMRTEDDEGTVTILDRRIVDTNYGRMMLEALPPFSRVLLGRKTRAA